MQMSRNFKKDYLRKLKEIKTENGFSVDMGNYMFNPSHDYDYPTLSKTIDIDEERQQKITYRYFKHYDGSGGYEKETHNIPKGQKNGWYIAESTKVERLEESNRFNLNKLIQLATA